MQVETDIVELARDVFITRIGAVATLTVLLYDYARTFQLERRLMWASRSSVVKYAFLLNRYIPFIAAIGFLDVHFFVTPANDPSLCKRYFTVFGCATVIEYHVAEFILFYRTAIIWHHTRWVQITLGVVYLIITALALYFASQFLKFTAIDDHFINPSGCVIISPGQINKPPIILLMLSETFATALLVAKSRGWRSQVLLNKLVSDGVIYYIAAILTAIANIAVISNVSDALCNVLLVTQAVLHSIFCNHLLLGIRGVNMTLTHTASLFTSPDHLPDVRLYLYQMASVSRVSRSIKFASSPDSEKFDPAADPTTSRSPRSSSNRQSPSTSTSTSYSSYYPGGPPMSPMSEASTSESSAYPITPAGAPSFDVESPSSMEIMEISKCDLEV